MQKKIKGRLEPPHINFTSSSDSSIFQKRNYLAHCTDEDQKNETIVCS